MSAQSAHFDHVLGFGQLRSRVPLIDADDGPRELLAGAQVRVVQRALNA